MGNECCSLINIEIENIKENPRETSQQQTKPSSQEQKSIKQGSLQIHSKQISIPQKYRQAPPQQSNYLVQVTNKSQNYFTALELTPNTTIQSSYPQISRNTQCLRQIPQRMQTIHYQQLKLQANVINHQQSIVSLPIYQQKSTFYAPSINQNNQLSQPTAILKIYPKVKSILKKIIVVGQSGTGKSSLLNYLFERKLKTGMGGCTSQFEIAFTQDNKDQIYDSPALPQTSSFNEVNSIQKYKQFLNYDKFFVVFDTSLKNIEKFVQLTAANKKDIVFIRTKCDYFDRSKLKTLDEELQNDRSLLEKWGIRNIKLYSATANPKSKNLFDRSAILRQFMID